MKQMLKPIGFLVNISLRRLNRLRRSVVKQP
jgi:hypothetical protein